MLISTNVIDIHLLYGKCPFIPQWSRNYSTNERYQHIEELSKSKLRIGRYALVELDYF